MSSTQEFRTFESLVREKYNSLRRGELYLVKDRNDVWLHYLESFPEGTNPIHLVNREYDCNCCKQFVRNVGALVSIDPSTLELDTVWNVSGAPYPFQDIANSMHEYVCAREVETIFRSSESRFGKGTTRCMKDGEVLEFNHFEGAVVGRHLSRSVNADQGSFNQAVGTLRRGLLELSPNALNEVISIIEDSDTAIYRGTTFLPQLKAFRDLQIKFDGLGDSAKNRLILLTASSDLAMSSFRNSVIGTLIQDLSSGDDMEVAVRKFEVKVAPHNYQRPKSLITPRMIQSAVATIDELGLRDALSRRHAQIGDVAVSDVIFVDRAVRPQMKDALVDMLTTQVKTRPSQILSGDGIYISIGDFLEHILPSVVSIDALFENKHVPNLTTITTAVDPNAAKLFKWDSNFAWSYNGGLADSDIKMRVKSAGGNVSAPFRVSLSWHNTDDLDLSCITPSKQRIFYGNKCGILDVDMNVSMPVRNAVENLAWRNKPQPGIYTIIVTNFNKRESVDVGFEMEVECLGQIMTFSYDKMLAHKEQVHALDIKINSDGDIESISNITGMKSGHRSQDCWNIKTQEFHKVKFMMLSPNHWGDSNVGNKHYFFILDNCLNPDSVRGMYNEYLRPDLLDHRKVFEILANQMSAPFSDNQLSGLGFSSTQKNSVKLRVDDGNKTVLYNVQF